MTSLVCWFSQNLPTYSLLSLRLSAFPLSAFPLLCNHPTVYLQDFQIVPVKQFPYPTPLPLPLKPLGPICFLSREFDLGPQVSGIPPYWLRCVLFNASSFSKGFFWGGGCFLRFYLYLERGKEGERRREA